MSHFTNLERKYLDRKSDQENFSLILSKDGVLSKYKPPLRFSQEYKNRTLYKLFKLRDLEVKSFITLTFPARFDTVDEYEKDLTNYRKTFPKVRAWWKKYFGFTPGYFRTYELTKKNALHLHIALYTEIDKKYLERFAHYYYNKFGFLDIRTFSYLGGAVFTYKFYINHDSADRWDLVGIYPEEQQKKVVTNYVMKYQLKDQSDMHKAIFSKYGIRTYSVSQNLRKHIRHIVSTGEYSVYAKGYNISLIYMIKQQLEKPKSQIVLPDFMKRKRTIQFNDRVKIGFGSKRGKLLTI